MKRIGSFLLALALSTALHAEVAVEKNKAGCFKEFHVNSRIEDGVVYQWDRNNGPARDDYLNLGGDGNGDGSPQAVLVAAGKLQKDPSPFVVWAHNAGSDFNIVYSRWRTGIGWTALGSVGNMPDVDELGVTVFLDPSSNVHAVWWSNSIIPGVWYSKFSGGVWSAPELVSDPLRDSRNPVFLLDGRNLYVRYDDFSIRPVQPISSLKERFDP